MIMHAVPTAVLVAVAVTFGLPLGFGLVMWPDVPLAVWREATVQILAIAMVSAVALYFYRLSDDQPVRYRTLAIKAIAGSVFGFLAAKAGAGAGFNESFQTAAAGVGGAKGPEYLDKVADAFAERLRK